MTGRRAALLTAVVLGAALVVVVAVVTPWSVLPDPSGGPVPVEPGAGLSGEQRRRAEAFAAALRPASLLSLVLGLGASAVLGLTGLGARLVTRVAAPFGGSRKAQLVLGVGALAVVGRLVTLPVSAYAEMVRHRYGLSTRGWALWLRDLTVATAISAVVTALALGSFLWLVRRAPRTWWAWSAGVAAGFVVVGSFLYPVLFEPAFNRFEPLPAGELRTDLLALAEESGVPVRDVLVSDASRRTTALNAYVSGIGATRRIVVYDTLLDELPDEQIESIVAHELGHVVHRDVLTGTLIGALGAAAATALLGWLLCWTPLLRRVWASGPGDPRAVPLVLFLLAAGSVLATPLQNTVSRQIEVRADLHALDSTGDPDAFVDMQRRLATTNISDPDPPAAWQWFFGSHPTTAQRVAFAQAWATAHRQ
ncbi:MAG: M48 family metallopeptidase [Actinomycetota bacterium]|nr:M48 family metallopeptidase [Actinomycetota bacterium]